MNMFKKNGGFTLVELIVVIAILAILAGVAVPAYSGYITKANQAADYTQLDSVKTAVVFAATEKNASATVTKMTVTEGSTEVAIVAEDAEGETITDLTKVDVEDFTDAIDFQSNATQAIWVAEDDNEAELKAGWNLK